MTYIEFVKSHIRKPELAHLKQTDKVKAIAAMWRKQKGGDLLGDQTVKILKGGDLLGEQIASAMRGGAVLGRRKPRAKKENKLFGGDVVGGQFQFKPLRPINIDSDFLHPDGGGAFNNRAINNMSDDYKRGFLLPFKFERKRKTK